MVETTIGELLRRYRKEARLKLEDVAKLIPCNPATVSRVENGDIPAQEDYIQAFIAIPRLALDEADVATILETFQHRGGKGSRNKTSPQATRAKKQTSNLLERYLKFIVDSYSLLTFRGLQVNDRLSSLPLLDVYVPLEIRTQIPNVETFQRTLKGEIRPFGADQLRIGGRILSQSEIETVGEQLSPLIPALSLLRQNDGIVVLGDPGSGKSTFVKFLALMVAQSKQEEIGLSQSLPLLLPMRAYALELTKRDLSLIDFCAEYFRNQTGASMPWGDLFTEALAAGEVLVLLDGLDEVVDISQRLTLVDRVCRFFTWHRQAGNKFVITSRIVGYRSAPAEVPGLVHCTLGDFDGNDIEDFIRKWTEAITRQSMASTRLTKLEARQLELALLTDIARHASIRRLAANPLLLTIMALMKRQGIELVERRVELYDHYVRTLLHSWNLSRSIDSRPVHTGDEHDIQRVMAQLALWMQEHSPGRGVVSDDQIRRKLGEIYTQQSNKYADTSIDQLLQDIREHGGLLIDVGAEEYGFIHLTFLEYLAAFAIALIAQESPEAAIRCLSTHVLDAHWREIVILSIGCAGLVMKLPQVATALVKGLLQLNVENRAELIALIGETTADAWPNGIDVACRNEVAGLLLNMMSDVQQVPSVVRVAAGNALGRIGDDRPEVMTVAGMQFCLVPAGAFDMSGADSNEFEHDDIIHVNHCLNYSYWMGRYPITQSQFKEFVRDDGYLNEIYWEEARSHKLWRVGEVLHGFYRWDTKDHTFIRSQQEWATRPEDYLIPFNLPNHPVNNVSWYEALAFTRWLNVKFKLSDKGLEARLPSDAEWEKAARGGQDKANWQVVMNASSIVNGWNIRSLASGLYESKNPTASPSSIEPINLRRFPWGDKADPNRCNCRDTKVKTTNAVGCFPTGVSAYGCEEMIGNTWEWTRSLWGYKNYDCLFTYPYVPNDGRENLFAPPEIMRTIRGGSWYSESFHARCAYRRRNAPDYLNENLGVRVVITPKTL